MAVLRQQQRRHYRVKCTNKHESGSRVRAKREEEEESWHRPSSVLLSWPAGWLSDYELVSCVVVVGGVRLALVVAFVWCFSAGCGRQHWQLPFLFNGDGWHHGALSWNARKQSSSKLDASKEAKKRHTHL